MRNSNTMAVVQNGGLAQENEDPLDGISQPREVNLNIGAATDKAQWHDKPAMNGIGSARNLWTKKHTVLRWTKLLQVPAQADAISVS